MYRGIRSELCKLKRTSTVSLLFVFLFSGVWRRGVWWMCTKVMDEPALTLLRVESILVTKVVLDPIYQNEGYRSPVHSNLDAWCRKKFGFQIIFTGFCYVTVPSTWNPHWLKQCLVPFYSYSNLVEGLRSVISIVQYIQLIHQQMHIYLFNL
jgi:hypothetical protein